MNNLYFISGLGADSRVFQFLELGSIEKNYIKWVDPFPQEPISKYAERLLDQIDITKGIILIGISFGGIIAQEISKHIKCLKVLIISSIKSPDEMSWQLILVKTFKLHLLLPPKILLQLNRLTADYYFSIQSKNESILLKKIILDTDLQFMKWAINSIMIWKNTDSGLISIHIHGTKDRVFPMKAIKSCIKTKDGGHFMIINKAQEISRLILSELSS